MVHTTRNMENIREMRLRCSEAQNHRCAYCHRFMSIDPDDREKKFYATIDHVIPKSDGGSDDYENLVAACQRCNNKRQSVNAYEYYEKREAREQKRKKKLHTRRKRKAA